MASFKGDKVFDSIVSTQKKGSITSLKQQGRPVVRVSSICLKEEAQLPSDKKSSMPSGMSRRSGSDLKIGVKSSLQSLSENAVNDNLDNQKVCN